MTPLQFETEYKGDWQELEALLKAPKTADALRLSTLYRGSCEQLALARSRAYPGYLIDRLERLTADGHQLLYKSQRLGRSGVLRIFTHDFPVAVRELRAYVWVALALLAGTGIVMGLLVYFKPSMILTLVDMDTAAEFEQMYSPAAESIGRYHNADSNWMMFGFYIQHNIGIAFQCFAGGLILGLGSLWCLITNGLQLGGITGYITARGLGGTFYAFVVTHGAFELTAIVLAGAAGLRMGYAWIAPGRQRRLDSLVAAARRSIVILYGVIGMLTIAAALEAFWSSAPWLPHSVKYSVAAVCWAAVLLYLTRQGRNAH